MNRAHLLGVVVVGLFLAATMLAAPDHAGGAKVTFGPEPSTLIRDVCMRHLEGLEVGNPVSYEGMQVFPLTVARGTDLDLVTVEEAIRRGWLEIAEVQGGGSVPALKATVKTDRAILLLAGDVVQGGKQDRIVAKDGVISGRGKTVTIPVRCVEHGRWRPAQGTVHFESKGYIANNELRKMLQRKASQEEVWANVAEQNVASGTAPASGALDAVYSSGEQKDKIERIVKVFQDIPELNANVAGVAVAIRGRISYVDIFPNPLVFRRFYRKLLTGYSVEKLQGGTGDGKVRPGDVKDFIETIANARFAQESPLDEGTLYSFNADKRHAAGTVATFEAEVAHLSMFPARVMPIEPTTPQLQSR